MTKDFEEQLNAFSVPETRGHIEAYFEKYWLERTEYEEKWRRLQYSVFDSTAKHLPDMMFNRGLELLPFVGGNIFTSEDDFIALQTCMSYSGDSYFAIVQNENVVIKVYSGDDNWGVNPPLRFKFPVEVSWKELMSGGYISVELFQGAAKDYFVFGDSGNWGRYVANDYANPAATPLFSTPLNIMGFKKEFAEFFRNSFAEIRKLKPEIAPETLISEWLPDSYKTQE